MEETKIKDHNQIKKVLTPPLAGIPKLTHSSWIHDRLPEMLWAILIIEGLERDEALNFFRHVGKYVSEKNEFSDITLTGISKIPEKDLEKFIKHLLNYSEDINKTLSPLLLYPELPSLDIWKKFLKKPDSGKDWERIHQGVLKTYDHQSQEATDCRWVKLLCLALGGKLKFSSRENAERILEYPNIGDMREVRPSIRAMEIMFHPEDDTWSNHFWKTNYDSTACMPEEAFNKKIEKRQEELSQEIKKQKKYYLGEIKRVRDKLISHFFDSHKDSKVNTRIENSFGLGLYSIAFLTEIVVYNVSNSLMGRIALRSLIENYITFKYLLKKEKEEINIWDDFQSYGTGQIKLIYLKLKELSAQSKCVEVEELNKLANEDKWLEFVPINLGHWGNIDLRKMSEYAEVKEIYDLYYNYTSGFVHGTRGALRESVYQRCLNVLHRFHRIPSFSHPLMEGVIEDSVKIVNQILECLNESYPSFTERIKPFSKS